MLGGNNQFINNPNVKLWSNFKNKQTVKEGFGDEKS